MSEINWKKARSYAHTGGDIRDSIHICRAFRALDALVKEMADMIQDLRTGVDPGAEAVGALLARAYEIWDTDEWGLPPHHPALRAETACIWSSDEETWGTSCGHCFTLNDGTPTDNGMKYCCYCGKTLETHTEPQIEKEQAGD